MILRAFEDHGFQMLYRVFRLTVDNGRLENQSGMLAAIVGRNTHSDVPVQVGTIVDRWQLTHLHASAFTIDIGVLQQDTIG